MEAAAVVVEATGMAAGMVVRVSTVAALVMEVVVATAA